MVWVPVGRSLVMDSNTRTIVVCVPLMEPSIDIVANIPRGADGFEVDDVLVILGGVRVALPGEGVLNPRAAGKLKADDISIFIFVVKVLAPDEEVVWKVRVSPIPGGQGGKDGTANGIGGGHDCHCQTIQERL